MAKKLLAAVLALILVLSCGSVMSVLADEFKPSNDNVVNVFCGFEDGDWMPMMHDTITSNDQLNIANFDIAISNKNAFSGSKSYVCSNTSSEGGYATFEWYQVKDGKHIYERNGNTDLMALYNAGMGMDASGADYLQFYVKNEANKALVIKWLRVYGSDCWGLKPFAKYVYILRDGEWEKLDVQNTFITIPRKYEGFIRVELRADNFQSGAWYGKEFDKSLVTAVGTYLHADQGGITGNLYIDDLAFVGKNLNIDNKICKITKYNEKDYFADFLGLEDEPVETQPKETQPKETQPKETQPKETQPKETQPKETQPPKDETPKETQPKETQPKETQPKDETPKETKPKDETPKETQPSKDETPKETKPKDETPKETQPSKDETPKETKPKDENPADETKDTYKEVNETVYTTQGVNVRSGPTSSSTKLGYMEPGTAVTRTGIGDNGWSRIEYNGQVAYVYSNYLTTVNPNPDASEPAETQPVETEPVETQPVETEPVETEPVETEPVETEPVETEPVETEPVETEPVETEPKETEPAPTEPKPTEPAENEAPKGGFPWWILVVVVLLGGGAAAVFIVYKKTGKWLWKWRK